MACLCPSSTFSACSPCWRRLRPLLPPIQHRLRAMSWSRRRARRETLPSSRSLICSSTHREWRRSSAARRSEYGRVARVLLPHFPVARRKGEVLHCGAARTAGRPDCSALRTDFGKSFGQSAPNQGIFIEIGCTTNPAYEQGADASADYALCKIPNAFPAFPGLVYERVRPSSFDDHVRKPVVLTGYGCTSDLVSEQEHSDKKYRVGRNNIVASSNSTDLRFGAEYYKGFQDNNFFTDDDPRQVIANLCPGDSGGPAFRRSAGGAAQFTNRQIIGVNYEGSFIAMSFKRPLALR